MLLLALLLTLIVSALARPDGAPIQACADMTPHHGIAPQTSTFPYVVVISSPSIDSRASVTITIKGGGQPTFKGFLIEGRTSGANAVGTFSTSGRDARVISSPGGQNNAATHVNNKDKKQVVLKWAPKADFEGTVNFFVTVVKEKTKFWVAQSAGSVKVIKHKLSSRSTND